MIKGAERMSDAEIIAEIARGGKLVVFNWCISIVVMTFKRGSDVHLIRAGELAMAKSLPYSALTLLVGWWGIPWGPIYSIQSLYNNFSGGIDVTDRMVRRG